jgi:hypothetical protein
MFNTYIQGPGGDYGLMRHLLMTTVLLLVASMIPGCGVLRSPDEDTVALCKRGFANNPDWTRASRFSRDARNVRKKFGSISFQPPKGGKPVHSTLWFRDARHEGFASCSRDRCEDGRCLWLVRLYEKNDGQWRLANDYQLGVPIKK